MDWIKRINEAIEYNLDKEIDYDRIEKITACSIYNFQRMFSYIADKSLSDYIRERRLTLAAFDILNSRVNLIDIALKYGYTHDSFTRAFQKFHGVIPSKVRTDVVSLKSVPRLSFTIKGESCMNYQITTWPKFTVSGIKKRIATDEAFKEVPKVWEEAGKNGTMNDLINLWIKADLRPSGLIGIADFRTSNDNGGKMDYYLGVTTDVLSPLVKKVETHYEEFHFPMATWVIFEAIGELPDAVQNVYKQFYTEWLPNSQYELADLPIIECYLQNNHQEVWIAIKPRE